MIYKSTILYDYVGALAPLSQTVCARIAGHVLNNSLGRYVISNNIFRIFLLVVLQSMPHWWCDITTLCCILHAFLVS